MAKQPRLSSTPIEPCPNCGSPNASTIANSNPPTATCLACSHSFKPIPIITRSARPGHRHRLDRPKNPEAQYALDLTNRARARYALRWRPRFLAALSLTRSQTIGCRTAGVSRMTVRAHRREDPDFDLQCCEAEEQATALLHDACWASALEGDIEPVYWQGIKVGHVRKFDSRLRIEMLRAHMPEKFKRDAKAQVNVNAQGGNVLVIGPEEHAALCAARRESLLRLQAAHEKGEQPLKPMLLDDLPNQ